MTLSCDLTIFEGPDGGGKSTAARSYAKATGARYVHYPSLPRVTAKGLGRMYLEAMLPALHGYQSVVFDRCWLSEQPYGSVFRPHQPLRVDKATQGMLERVAMRCSARVIYCLPGLDVCLDTFRSRRGDEYLDREEQLEAVYCHYDLQVDYAQTYLPFSVFDRTKHDNAIDLPATAHTQHQFQAGISTTAHDVRLPTVGNRLAPVCLIGDNFGERKDNDLWQQYPFVSFNRQGCSHWLAEYLGPHAREDELCWANADFDLKLLAQSISAKHYIALGASAAKALDDAGLPYSLVSHPQHQKRFNTHDDYPLGPKLRVLIDGSVATAAQGSAAQRS